MSLFRRSETVPKSCYDEMAALVGKRYDESVVQIENLRKDLADTRKALSDVLGVLDQAVAPMMQGMMYMSEEEEDARYQHDIGLIDDNELKQKLAELGVENIQFG